MSRKIETSEMTKRYNEYIELLDKDYKSAIAYLLKKYGECDDDYYQEKSYYRYLNNEIKRITKGKYSRAKEGLECHHIFENKYIDISNSNAIKEFKYPYYIQKKENLVYCDIFEHFILHTLIIKETEGEYGLGGSVIFIKPKIKDWFISKKNPKPEWMKACKKRARLSIRQTREILYKADETISEYRKKQKMTYWINNKNHL